MAALERRVRLVLWTLAWWRRECFRKGTGHRDDHRLLALADVPAAQVVGEDQPLGIAARVRREAGLDAGDLAGGQTVTSVEEDAVGAQDDGLVLALGLDGLGQVVQLVGAEHREHAGGGVGLDDGLLVGWGTGGAPQMSCGVVRPGGRAVVDRLPSGLSVALGSGCEACAAAV
ncbi:hypothetical protein OG483_17405 [[Kitasatospora] papulosa]|uniref:hypothetical protein n=1 Tax=[Kitasatospora] papulosa TaxID=1464011 RepID=UPI002E0FF41B|nr:hypothetical protein OG483_17405 [[Kitasatospora] papulosa]